MWQRVRGATNRTLAFSALGAVAVIVAIQIVFFGIWGDDGDPPDAALAVTFPLFWGSLLVLVGVAVLAVSRLLSSRRSPS